MNFWGTSSNVGNGLTSGSVSGSPPSSQSIVWTEVTNAAPETDGGITSTGVEASVNAVASQQLTDGKYWEIIPNQVSSPTSSLFFINTAGNRDVSRRISFGGGYLTFYDTSNAWQGQTAVTTSSVIRISLEGTTLKFYKDGNPTPVFTYTDTLSAPLELRMNFWGTSSNVGNGLTSGSISQ